MRIYARPTRSIHAVVAAAMATLLAACNGDSGNNNVTPPPQQSTVTSVSVNPASVRGGTASQGSVTVAPAPSAATNVSLVSSNAAAATVPASTTVAANATTGTFTVNTSAVAASTPVTISASLNGTVTTTLTVTPNVPTASFVVRALSEVKRKLNSDPAPVTILPAGTLDACPLAPNAQGSVGFDCEFDGSASTAPAAIQQYNWTYFVGPRMREETSTTPIHRPTESSCNFFGGLTGQASGGLQFLSIRVDLRVRDATGALSDVVSSQNIRVFPAGQCGYGF